MSTKRALEAFINPGSIRIRKLPKQRGSDMELTIRACEGGFYLAHLDGSDIKPEKICASFGVDYRDNMKFHSLGRIKDHFGPLDLERVWLVHNVAYDEMIGLPSNESEHRQPLHWHP